MIDDYDESSGWMFLLVPAHPGFPGQIPQSHKTVVCVCVCVSNCLHISVDSDRWCKTLPLNCGKHITRMSENVSTVRRNAFSHSFNLYVTRYMYRSVLRQGLFVSLISSHFIWPHLSWPHFIWTECAVIGYSHGELGGVLWSDPVCHAAANHSALSSDEMRSGEMSDVNAPLSPNCGISCCWLNTTLRWRVIPGLEHKCKVNGGISRYSDSEG